MYKIIKSIKQEIKYADYYIDTALKNKEDNKEVADIFYRLSLDNIERINTLQKSLYNVNKIKLKQELYKI